MYCKTLAFFFFQGPQCFCVNSFNYYMVVTFFFEYMKMQYIQSKLQMLVKVGLKELPNKTIFKRKITE